jgi:hypothetical protein
MPKAPGTTLSGATLSGAVLSMLPTAAPPSEFGKGVQGAHSN